MRGEKEIEISHLEITNCEPPPLLSSPHQTDHWLCWGDWADTDKDGRIFPFGAQYTLGVISCVKYLHSLPPSLLSLIKKIRGQSVCVACSVYLFSQLTIKPIRPCDLTPPPPPPPCYNDTLLLLHWTQTDLSSLTSHQTLVDDCQSGPMLTVNFVIIIWADINVVNTRQFYI